MQTKPHIEIQAPLVGVPAFLASVAVVLVLMGVETLHGSDTPAASEAQVKAAFLFNFAKYVDWPPSAFSNAMAPITIGVIRSDPFGDALHRAEGKTINGHPFVIKDLSSESDLTGCQILFISHSESFRMAGILEKARSLPILTVGEDDAFAQNGGIINFVLKKGNIRLEIDLAAARKARLTISSRLLAVADVVKGKAN
jgi:hypothetical protein